MLFDSNIPIANCLKYLAVKVIKKYNKNKLDLKKVLLKK